MSALLSGIAAPRVHAQDHELTDQWVRDGGTVEVSPGALNIEEGESLTYRIRLTRPLPVENGNRVGGWWVRVHVDGAVRSDGVYDADGDGENDIRWVPSVGWEFNPSDWPQGRDESRWREITVYGLSALDQPVSFKHEVWDHDAYCPQGLHPDGLPVVTVNVIPDQPPEPLPALSIRDAARVIEDSDASFEVRLSKSSQRVVTVAYETESGTAVEGSDFDRASGTLTFDPGSTKQTIEVQTRDDELDEADEKFTVKLSSPNWATLDDETGTGTGTIGDNDAPPKLSIGDAVVGEGGAAQFAVTLDTASGQEVTVRVQTRNGTAQAGSDYDAVDVTLTFDVGATRQTFDVQTTLDAVYEADETFTVRLRSPNGATLDGGTGDGTITDDDPKPSLSIEDVTVNEGERARFEVTLSGERALTVTVRYETQDDTAVAASDYDAREGTLTFSPGDNSEIVEVRTREDTAKEPVETFTVVLSDPKEATVDRATGTGTITDDDEGALPSLRIEDATADEGEIASFTVSLSVTSEEDVTVEYETQDGTADAGSDYTAIDDGTLTITSGNLQATIPVETLPDDDYEGAEAFTVRLSDPDGATLDRSTATGTIDDDDDPPLVSIGNATVPEGETAEFEVMLDALSNLPVKVRYATKGGTAVEGTDYTRRSGTLTFQPGNDTLTIEVHTREDSADEPDETFTVELSDQEDARLGNAIGTGEITDDDDPPQVSIGDAPTVTEGNPALFPVTLNVASGKMVTVMYRTVDGTAMAGPDLDYMTTAGKLEFEPGTTRLQIAVPTSDDELSETQENFTVELSDETEATLNDATGEGTIRDNDPLPELSIADAAPAPEGGAATFTVTLNKVSGQTVTVEYETRNGTATADSDFTPTSGTLEFEPGDTEETLSVDLLDDSAPEDPEEFTVVLSSPSAARLQRGSGTGTITDNDVVGPLPTVSIGDAEAVGEGGEAVFTVTLSPASSRLVTVKYATDDGTALAGTDYRPVSETLRFAANETTKTIRVRTIQDTTAEQTENFTVELSDPAGATLGTRSGTGTITDDDEGGLPEVSIGDAPPVTEGSSVEAEFTVRLTVAVTEEVTVEYRTVDGTAVADRDYTTTAGTLRFAANDMEKTISVPVADDTTAERTEYFTVELSDPRGATLGRRSGTGTINDNDTGGVPALTIENAPAVTEGGTALFLVRLSAASNQAVTVAYQTVDETAAAGTDYTATRGDLRFEVGTIEQTIAVPTLNDTAEERTETFTVELSEPNGATLEQGTGTATINDDDSDDDSDDDDGDGGGTDSIPTLTIRDSETVTEGDPAEFVVRLSAESEQAVTVAFATADGTAKAGSDYTSTTGTLRFEPGDRELTITVPTVDDDQAEETEAFTVKLSDPSGATLEDDTGTGRITDDDGLPTLSIADALPVAEGDAAEFAVTLNPASEQVVTVAFATADGTAKAGSDYTSTTGTLRFEPGDRRKTIAVPTVDDEQAEETEAFAVTLSGPSGATLEDDTGAGTINDDDGSDGSLPGLIIADAVASEGDPAEFVVRLSAASERVVTVAFATADGTAKAGSDYTATSGTLRFEPGETAQTITVAVLDDETSEAEEGFAVELSAPSGATLADSSGTGTITDDDEPPELEIDDAPPVSEGETAEFAVRLSAVSGQVVTVSYRTVDGTAVAGSDYTSTTATLRFEPGETTRTITVAVLDDETSEAEERFTVELSAPSGATLGDSSGTGTIIDDDEPPELEIDDAPPVSEGETAEFAVRLSAVSGQVVTVSYRTVDGTAVSGSDYASASGILRFEPGETAKTIDVVSLDDETHEAEEGFTVELSLPSWSTIADGTGVGTILDDDDPPELSIDDAPPVAEGETAEFVVHLSAASGVAVTVSYRSVDGTAVAGTDYAAIEGTLRFEPGETTHTLGVEALTDELVEGAEQFAVELSDPAGATIADGTGVGTITDDPRRRIDLVNRTVLPEIGRALAFTPVRCRIDQAFSDGVRGRAEEPVAHLSLSPGLTSGGRAAAGTAPRPLEQVLGDSSFLMGSQEGEGGGGRFAAWGCGDYQSLAGGGDGGAVAWDGEVFSVQIGADVRLSPGVLAGLSVSRSRGSFDYYAGAGNREALGAYDLRLTGVHPYVGWSLSPDLDVWGTLGHAWGELRITDELAGDLTSVATLNSGAVGVTGRLLARGGTTLRLKGEGALARLDVAGASFGAATMDMRRLRLSTEAGHEHVFASGASLTPWGELGLRHDGGDGETGAGLEVGGGLRYRNPEAGWITEGYGRWLAAHEGALREWGVGAVIRFDPGVSGRGPSVSLEPAWGETGSGVQRLWERGATDPILRDAPGRRLDAQFAYGFAALRGRGVLTPYGTVSLAREYGRGYRLGGRLAVGRSATVSLEAERRERAAAAAVHMVMVRGAIRF